MQRILFLSLLSAGTLFHLGCSPGSDSGNCDNGRCDNGVGPGDGADKPCAELIRNFSGSGEEDRGLDLDDAISKLVLNATDTDGNPLERCPMSVPDIVEQLTESGCSGLGTQMVSERAQPLEVFTDYRAVVDMDCPQGKVFLHFPIHAREIKDSDGLNGALMTARLKRTFPAIIAQDSEGTFNFYQSKNQSEEHFCGSAEEVSTQECTESVECTDPEFPACVESTNPASFISDFRFFGNSMDYLSQETRHDTIAQMKEILPIAGTSEVDVDHTLEIDANCAGCHPNGGILIREFDSPWVHWEHSIDSPEYEQIIAKPRTDQGLAFLGSRKDGLTLERTVANLNSRWNQTRVTKVLEKMGEEFGQDRTLTTGDLLRPLLCTDEFMIGTSGSTRGGPISRVQVGNGAVVDQAFGISSFRVQGWEDEIEKAGWFLAGFWNPTLHDILKSVGGGKFGTDVPRDTFVGATFMKRARIDIDYQNKLRQAGVVNQKLINALLAVDFTRAIFSDERCSLVEVMNQVDPNDYVKQDGELRVDADLKLNAAIRKVLRNEDGGGFESAMHKELHDALPPSAPEIDLRAIGSDFRAACEARPIEEFTRNYVRYLTNVRHRAAGLSGSSTVDSSFLLWRFPGSNGFMMPQALHEKEIEVDGVTRRVVDTSQGVSGLKGLEPGITFNEDCTMDAPR